MTRGLAPFWRYYGGKNRAAPLYPQPEHDTIVEPFAGAAGYSCRYPDRRVILVDRSPIIAGIWRYLIATPAAEILRLPDIPEGGTVDDLPVCQEARWLAGFWCNNAVVSPRKSPSKWARRGGMNGWGPRARARIARQIVQIRHWKVIEGEYHDAPDIESTWHIDPPYLNAAGEQYQYQPGGDGRMEHRRRFGAPTRTAAFAALGEWCKTRRGLVMVCENAGAEWLPFRPLADIRSNGGAHGKGKSREVIWLNRRPATSWGVQASLFGAA